MKKLCDESQSIGSVSKATAGLYLSLTFRACGFICSGRHSELDTMKRDMHAGRPPRLKFHRPEGHQNIRRPPSEIPPVQYRQPVIIHTYSPEIIQTDPNNFMRLVQRLTGPGSPQPAPMPKRARLSPPSEISGHPSAVKIEGGADDSGIHADRFHQFATTNPVQRPLPIRQRAKPVLPALSTRGGHLRQVVDNPDPNLLPPNSLLSPRVFDFSPSLLPSPSTFGFDFPSLHSPSGFPSPAVPGSSTPGMSLPNMLPSPGPLTSTFFADLPPLSPAAYKWIERNGASADAILSSRPMTTAGLPPRPPGHFPIAATSNSDERLAVKREQ